MQGCPLPGFGVGPAVPMARVGGLKGAARPLTSCEWSGQGEALSWPREYAGEEITSKGTWYCQEGRRSSWRDGQVVLRLIIIPKRLGFC